MMYVCGWQETFCTTLAMAELARTRNHVLPLDGLCGMPEAVTNQGCFASSEDLFIERFLDAWVEPESPAWYAQGKIPDRSPDALAPAWEKALGLM